MLGAIPQIPQYAFMAWCLVKHRDFNFTIQPFENLVDQFVLIWQVLGLNWNSNRRTDWTADVRFPAGVLGTCNERYNQNRPRELLKRRTSVYIIRTAGVCLWAKCWGEYLDIRQERTGDGEDCMMRSFITCTLHHILLGWPTQGGIRNAFKKTSVGVGRTWGSYAYMGG